jgi:hypothetical protein
MSNEAMELKVPKIPQPIPWKDFLENTPPGSEHQIQGLAIKPEPSPISQAGSPVRRFSVPPIIWSQPTLKLYCASPDCDDDLNFRPQGGPIPADGKDWQVFFLWYKCKNCDHSTKVFALRARRNDPSSLDGFAAKLGEWPPFGPRVPSKLFTLLREDRDLFIKGRRAESQGLGIGSYAYYRRVVENQKNNLIDQIIKVSTRTNARPEILTTLEAARTETQFSKALASIKDTIPSVLLIDGHSPLQLLHQATSKGVHELSDQECLDRATTIRLVLADLVERMNQVLKDDRELRAAIGKLTRPTEQSEGQ